MRRGLTLVVLITALIAAACGGTTETSSDDAIATIVAATLEASGASDDPQSIGAGQPEGSGSIGGSLGYPSEGIPALNVVAYSVNSTDWYMVTTEANRSSYQIDNLPPGPYYVVAYPIDSDFGGGYTAAVPCGLTVDCTDHSLLPVEVPPAQVAFPIDPIDWYAGENAFPPNPAKVESTGSISGALGYPSEGIPPMDVVAFSENGQNYYLLQTVQNQTSYQFDDLPAGNYTVVAYVSGTDNGGGYTAAVPCGLSVDCTDHSLLSVAVASGNTTEGVDLTDWYAGENAFLPNPFAADGIGSISGSLSYPSSGIPSLTVVAFNVETNTWQYIITQAGQSFYQISGLPTGSYYVVAYVTGSDEGGGYTAAVPCGLNATCTNHSLIPVVVTNNNVTEGVDPGDWYAGQGAFPANPAP